MTIKMTTAMATATTRIMTASRGGHSDRGDGEGEGD